MEYLNFVALAIVTCTGYFLGLLTAYYYFGSKLTKVKNQWADKATIANLLRSQLGKGKDESALYEAAKSWGSDELSPDSIEDNNIQKDSVVETIDKIIKLISVNIKLGKGHENFDVDSWQKESSRMFDLRVKYIATKIKDKSDFRVANKIYNKHKKLQNLLVQK